MHRRVHVLWLRLRSLVRRGAADRELRNEILFHLEQRTSELIDEGMMPEEARLQAQREFGSNASIEEQCRDARRVRFFTDLMQDTVYSLRTLRAMPALLIAASLSIALGVGANLTIFGLASDLLLSSPTARDAGRLVHIRTTNGSHVSNIAWQRFNDSGALAGIAGYRLETGVTWRAGDFATTVTPIIVTANFFDVVGVPVAHGRGFSAREAAVQQEPRLVVSTDDFFRHRLAGQGASIGSAIVLNGEPYTLIGVLAPGVRLPPGFGVRPDVIVAQNQSIQPGLDALSGSHVQLIGRLHPDQSWRQGRARLAPVAAQFGEEVGRPEMGGIRAFGPVGSLSQLDEAKEIAVFFIGLLVVTALVLSIACANVSGLLLSRSAARRKEIALRVALGATRWRLVRQLLTESMLLSAIGTAVGLTLTWGIGLWVEQLSLPVPLPIEFSVSLDARVVALACALVVVSTLLSGLTPAIQVTRVLTPALTQAPIAIGGRRLTLRTLLVGGQVAVSTLLLVVTALFLRNLLMAQTAAPGFDVSAMVAADVTFPQGRQGTTDAPAVARLVTEIRALPGVSAAAVASGVPLTFDFGGETGTFVRIDDGDPIRVDYFSNTVGPGYFEVLGLRVLRGRAFNDTDRPGAPRAAVVNATFARRYLPGSDPIGRRINAEGGRRVEPLEIVGVVDDSKYRSLGEASEAAVYEAYFQNPADRSVWVVVRSSVPPETTLAAIGRAIAAFDPSVAYKVDPMTTAIAFAFVPSRLGALLVGTLGVLGAVLAIVGLYGTVSFAVSRRSHEIGVRMTLGASRRAVLRLVMREGMSVIGGGVLIGLGLAFVVTGPLRAFLSAELTATDPISYVSAAAVLGLAGVAACWSPARRATRVDPTHALRVE